MVVIDRGFAERDFEHPLIVDLISRNRWQNFAMHRNGRFSWELVREFFANIQDQGRGADRFTWIRGTVVDFRPDAINRVLRLTGIPFTRMG